MYRIVMTVAFCITVGFVLMVAVPNLTTALNRSKQKRTLADLRTISAAWEARAAKTSSYDIASRSTCTVEATAESFGKLCTVSADQLARVLEPTYIKQLPRIDGWGSPFDFRVGRADAKGHAQTYAIRSRGKDHRADSDSYTSSTTHSDEQDLIYSDGSFLTFPEGV